MIFFVLLKSSGESGPARITSEWDQRVGDSMRSNDQKYSAIVALTVAMLQFGAAGAQETVSQAGERGDRKKTGQATVETKTSGASPNGDASTLGTIIVTGTSLPRRQFDAAYANSTISEQQIEVFAPLSAVDLISRLAGFGTEPSGGEGGNNLNVRGLPIRNFLFIPLLQDGLPIFQEAQEAFLDADELVRVDLMTDRVEAVRGGTSPIYTSNAPRATINFITKKGSKDPQGAVRATWGDYGIARFDAQWSGPIADDLLVSLGGFYRVDDGLRPTGFTADQGGQFRINLTRLIRGGEVTVYANRLHNKTAFYLPIPLADPRNPSVSLSHLIDPREGTLTSSDVRHARIRTLNGTPGGTTVDEDLSEGIRSNITVIGGSAERKLGNGWTVSDKVRYTVGTVKFNALFSLTPPQDADAFLASQLSRAQARFGPGVSRLAYALANARGPNGTRINIRSLDHAGFGGEWLNTQFITETQNYGVELEGSWRPNPRFELFGNVTMQNPTYKNLSVLGSGQAIPEVEGSNLTNEIGLTEGNPRTDPLVGQGTSTAIYARPIFGRAIRMSLTYSW